MTAILHISDLHFGRVDAALPDSLLEEIKKREPDIVVISGDFTQRARRSEFHAAQEFIGRIGIPVFTVPGNHDIPHYGFAERFFNPFGRYRAYINHQLNALLVAGEVAIVGLNSARAILPHWNWSHGLISKRQIAWAAEQFRAHPGKCRILVCHHPLLAIHEAPIDTIVWGGRDTVKMLLEQDVELILTGHIHHAAVTAAQPGHRLVSVGAGTATSTRLRKQTNGYNFIRIGADEINIELVHRLDGAFTPFQTHTIQRQPGP